MISLEKILDSKVTELLKTTEGRKFLEHIRVSDKVEQAELQKLLTETKKLDNN